MGKEKIKILLIILLLTFSIGFVTLNWENIINLDVDTVANFLETKGGLASLIFLGIYMCKPIFIVIPAALVSFVGGIVFGPVEGFILNMLGFFLSGTFAFYLSRFLGKDFVEKILKGKMLELSGNMRDKGFKILFLLRLPPILPYDPLSYACGLTRIRYKDFILASLLGVVPETLCYSIMGRGIFEPFSPKFILPIIVLIAGVASSGFFFKKRHNVK